MKNRTLFLIVISWSLHHLAAAQSGWTMQKGELYAQLTASSFSSDQYFSLAGTPSSGATELRQQAFNLYAEYGLTPRLTGLLNTSLLRLNSYATTDVVAAPGDAQLGVKFALSQKIPIAISVLPEIPLGKADNYATAKEPNALGIYEQVNLATTDGEVNVWTVLAMSASLPKGQGWASLNGGWNKRTKGFSDQFRAGLELGYKPMEKLYLKGCFGLLGSFGEAKTNVPFFRGEGTEMTAASIGAGLEFGNGFGLVAEYWRNLDFWLTPKNAYLGRTLTLGFSYQINPE